MAKIFLTILFFGLTVAGSAANAYQPAYKCIVVEASRLSEDGLLEDWKYYIGAEFVVDKATGRMNGKLKNHGYFGEPKVIDPGGNEQALKVVTIYDAGFPAVDYLYIETFSSGYKKPFIFRDGSSVFNGLCEPY